MPLRTIAVVEWGDATDPHACLRLFPGRKIASCPPYGTGSHQRRNGLWPVDGLEGWFGANKSLGKKFAHNFPPHWHTLFCATFVGFMRLALAARIFYLLAFVRPIFRASVAQIETE